MKIDVLYFAWLRERIGVPREQVDTDATTVRDLVTELAAMDEWHGAAFADMSAVRCAVDQELVDLDAALNNAREVAFFPPMTGG